MNVVTLRGQLSRPAEERSLPSGDRLVQLELTVAARPGAKAESVPVVYFDAPASVAGLDASEEVVVVGRVRRRFFRTAGGTQSRTEVVADHVVPSRYAKKAAAAIEKAQLRIDESAAGVTDES
jgi:single-strand DNA-binding protein